MKAFRKNLLLNVRRAASLYGYSRLKEIHTAPPLYINIDLTNACNYRCGMCPQSSPDGNVKRGHMDFELFRKIIKDAKEFAPVEQVSLFLAGEPLLSKKLEECVRFARKELDIRPNIASNLSLLTQSRAQDLIKAGLGSIVVDFSSNKNAFEHLRKGGNWDETFEKICMLIETRRKLNSRYPLIILKDISTGQNEAEARPDAGELRGLFPGGIDAFQKYKFHNWGGLVDGLKARIKSENTYYPCSHLWFNMPIQFDGKVSACCRDAEGKLIVGDAAEKRLSDIWNDEPIVELRRALIRKEYKDIPLCSRCDRLWTGGYFGGSPLQIIKRLLKNRPGGFRLGYR